MHQKVCYKTTLKSPAQVIKIKKRTPESFSWRRRTLCLFMQHLDSNISSQKLLDFFLGHYFRCWSCCHCFSWCWALAVQVWERVEPAQGEGTSKCQPHSFPAAGLLPGWLLVFKSLNTLQEEKSLWLPHTHSRYLGTKHCSTCRTAHL